MSDIILDYTLHNIHKNTIRVINGKYDYTWSISVYNIINKSEKNRVKRWEENVKKQDIIKFTKYLIYSIVNIYYPKFINAYSINHKLMPEEAIDIFYNKMDYKIYNMIIQLRKIIDWDFNIKRLSKSIEIVEKYICDLYDAISLEDLYYHRYKYTPKLLQGELSFLRTLLFTKAMCELIEKRFLNGE